MKTSLKGLLLILLVFVLALSLFACSELDEILVDPNDPAVVEENERKAAESGEQSLVEATVTIRFKNGDITVKSVTFTKGTALTEEQIPAGLPIAGKTFVGWYINGVKVEAGYVLNEAVTVTAKYTDTPVTPVVTKVSVTFKAQGSADHTVEVEKGATLAAADIPADPTPAAGYRFVGWYAGNVAFDATAAVTANVTYEAKFELIPPTVYTLTFKVNADDPNPTVVEVNEGEKIAAADIPADPTPAAGYRFVGWYVGNVAFDATAAVTANVTYEAKFELIPPTVYTLTFKVNADDPNPTVVEVNEGEKIAANDIPADPTPAAGYQFVAWKTAENVAFDADAIVTADATYIAEFALIPPTVYTLTFKVNADDPNPIVVEVNEGEKIAANDIPDAPTPAAGYQFVAWKTAENVVFDADAIVTADVTYIAEFALIPPSTVYTLTFKVNADDPNPIVVEVNEGEKIATADIPADPTPDAGYQFVAWKTAENVVFDADAIVTADVTYIAEFALIPPTVYTVTFKVSADDPNPTVVEVNEGEKIAAADIPADPTPAAGYQFVAWKTAENVVFDADAIVTADVTYIAEFALIPPTVYTLTFKVNADDPNPTVVQVNEGETIAEADIPADPVAPAGYYFVAWKSGEVAFDKTAAVTADVTYIAEFALIPPTVYTVTFKVSADDPNPTVVQVNEGETIAEADIPADPVAPAGYYFVAWKSGDVVFDKTAVVTANVTYIAEFALIPPTVYTLTFKVNADDPNPTVVEVNEGETIAEADIPADPTAPAGYRFVAWKSGDVVFDKTAVVTANVTYIAVFEVDENQGGDDTHDDIFEIIPESYEGVWQGTLETITYTWTIDANGISLVVNTEDAVAFDVVSYDENTKRLTVKDEDDYECVLVDNGDGTLQMIAVVPDADDINIQLTKQVPPQPTVYTLTFKVNADDPNPTVVQVNEGETIAEADIPADPTPAAGYYFVAWKSGEVAFDKTAAVTADATYIAEFALIPPTVYTLTFKVNADDPNPTVVEVNEGETIAEADIPADPTAPAGYHFVAWKSGDVVFDKTAVVTANVTYIAEFAADPVVPNEDPDDTLPDAFDKIPVVFVGSWNGDFGGEMTVTITANGEISGAPVALEVVGISATMLTLQSSEETYTLEVIDSNTLRLTETSSHATGVFAKVI